MEVESLWKTEAYLYQKRFGTNNKEMKDTRRIELYQKRFGTQNDKKMKDTRRIEQEGK